MMKTRIVSLLIALLLFAPLFGSGQGKDPILLTVGGEGVTKSEFLSIYLKNNPKGQKIDKDGLKEYLELYIKFKLKVKEAEAMGMDTTTAFITELAGYRKDLAKPYLTDKTTIDRLVKEAYDRMQYDLRASHILILIEKDASPADTLEAYNKAVNIRQEYLNGADFGALAAKYSGDPSARDSKSRTGQTTIPGNRGDLGYFTALDMVYEFENGAYNTPKGEVSMPVRSDYGYHLIKVTDRKPAMGKATIAHIHVSMAPSPSEQDSARAYDRIFQIHKEIVNGMPFEEAAKKFSDDKSSAAKGGVLPEFGVNRMVPEIIGVIAKLDSGEISAPVRTNYGWHIIKLIDRKGMGDFESSEAQLRSRVSRDGRAALGREQAAKNIHDEFRSKFYKKNLEALRVLMDSSILVGSWTIPEGADLGKKVLKIKKQVYTQLDFAEYIVANQRRYRVSNIDGFVDMIYHKFTNDKALEYLDERLEERNPEFKMLVKEYRDGILLFNLMDEKVWSKAVKDTTGLREYYNKHINEYMWGERVDATIYTCASAEIAELMRTLIAQGLTGRELLDTINHNNPLNLKVESNTFEKGDNAVVDKVEWTLGFSDNVYQNGQVYVVEIKDIMQPQPKTFREARGLVTAAYQDTLEKEWIEELRAKYPVTVNQKVLDSIE